MTSYINLRCWEKFLSTPPSRVATVVAHKRPRRWVCFYPRHPRGWRRNLRSLHNFPQYVSIHATVAGGDIPLAYRLNTFLQFLSTPPSRVATETR